jgi:hypothetical protein
MRKLENHRRQRSSSVRLISHMSHRVVFAVAATLALMPAVGARPVWAQPVSIAGNWSGSGVVRLPNGNSESVKCRASFTHVGNGARMNATCANASVRVSQSAELTRAGGNRFVGDFVNAEYNISGSIRIVMNGSNSMSAALSGGGGTATFTLSR